MLVRRFACLFVAPLALAGTIPGARADGLEAALNLVPDQAVAWAVVPSLSSLNADLSDLIDRADRPELAVAGRPVDVMVSQFGVAAGFDERGSFAIWSPTIDDLLLGAGTVAVPVESSFAGGGGAGSPGSCGPTTTMSSASARTALTTSIPSSDSHSSAGGGAAGSRWYRRVASRTRP